ncbi:MAG TPA: methylamine utilization protein [Caulobacteraceae bacterium]|nr:methylamine utilization protein [Caulobacteraceae bacterium]
MRLLLALLALLVAPLPAWAGDVSVSVRTAQGRPVANAVVTITAPHDGAIHFPWPYRMAQQNLQFDPFVLIVPAGADVSFPNLDMVRHHVYSFSPAKKFELKLYGRDETRLVHFERPGIIDLGCNIHDQMIAYIAVVDTPYAALTNASGEAVIHSAPAGARPMQVWQPYLKSPANTLNLTVTVPSQGVAHQSVVADLRPPPPRGRNY